MPLDQPYDVTHGLQGLPSLLGSLLAPEYHDMSLDGTAVPRRFASFSPSSPPRIKRLQQRLADKINQHDHPKMLSSARSRGMLGSNVAERMISK